MCQETWFAVQKYKKIIYVDIMERVFSYFNMPDEAKYGIDRQTFYTYLSFFHQPHLC